MFQGMLDKQEKMKFKGTRFVKAFKKTKEPAIKTVPANKEINKKRCDGGIWDKDNNRWLPIHEKEEEDK